MLDQDAPVILRNTLAHGKVPEELKNPANWPELMQREWSTDEGALATREHRNRCFASMRKIRTAIEEFDPDFILMWGDDQYENFVEDIVPPFCVYILDCIESQPYAEQKHEEWSANIWGEPSDKRFAHRGHPEAARFLVNKLNDRGIQVPYAYRLRYERGLSHAFINTMLYLDCDRTGFDYPILPFHVNCYGGEVIRRRGGFDSWAVGEPDPPSPSARSCFEVGRAIGSIFRHSRYRVAVLATSSWSHAFLTEKNHGIYPDHASDLARLAELRENRFAVWADIPRSQFEQAGQHEFLNWVCLAGAMTETGSKAQVVDYVETYVLNSNKCFALFPA